MKNFFAERKHFTHVTLRLCELILKNEDDMLDEILAEIYPYFENTDLTLYDCKGEKLLASTALNEDILDAIRYECRILNKRNHETEFYLYDHESFKNMRPNVQKIAIVPMFTKMEKDIVLCIEIYSDFDQRLYKYLHMPLQLLAIGVEVYSLTLIRDASLGRDKPTNLLMRDSLITKLEELCVNSDRNFCLGIIAISNVANLNETVGAAVVDDLLRGIGIELNNQMYGRVYRIGGTKFACIFQGDVYGAYAVMENLVDRILMLDGRIITSNVLTPVADGAYETLYICESHLKYTEEDVIRVVRNKADMNFQAGYQDIKETYFADATVKEDTDDAVVQMESYVGEEFKDKPRQHNVKGKESTLKNGKNNTKTVPIHENIFVTSGLDDIEPPEYAICSDDAIIQRDFVNEEEFSMKQE